MVSRPGIGRYLGLVGGDRNLKLTDSGLMIFSRLPVIARADHYFTSATQHDRFAMKVGHLSCTVHRTP